MGTVGRSGAGIDWMKRWVWELEEIIGGRKVGSNEGRKAGSVDDERKCREFFGWAWVWTLWERGGGRPWWMF